MDEDEWHGRKAPLINKIGTGQASTVRFVICVMNRKQELCRKFQLQKYRNLWESSHFMDTENPFFRVYTQQAL